MTGCSDEDSDKSTVKGIKDVSAAAEHSGISMKEMDFSYSDRDLDQEFNKDIATVIDLNDDETVISGSGAEIVEDDGSYILKLTEEKAYFSSTIRLNVVNSTPSKRTSPSYVPSQI